MSKMQISEFIDYFRSGSKKREDWRIGVEVEVFGFQSENLQRITNSQVEQILARLAHGEKDVLFEGNLLVETRTANGGKFTVEPGGQIEFSSVPHSALSEIETDLRNNFLKLRTVGEEFGCQFAAVGFDPWRTLEEQNWFMKPRYKVMKPYLKSRGARSWDMMTRTCAVQINLDFSDEADLAKKFIVANRFAPIVSAIFANSPFREGEFTNFASNRLLTWLETDDERSGISPAALSDGFSYEKFIEYALDVPMLFYRRENKYANDFTGKPFREFIAAGNATTGDFQDHLTGIFTEARLKNYLEIRCGDSGNLAHVLAFCAFWKGLLYDPETLLQVFEITPTLSAEDYRKLQRCIAEKALEADHGRVLKSAEKLFRLAEQGLKKIAPAEAIYLEPIRKLIFEKDAPAFARQTISDKSSAGELLERMSFY